MWNLTSSVKTIIPFPVNEPIKLEGKILLDILHSYLADS